MFLDAISEAARSPMQVPADHLRDCLIRSLCPLAGPKRRAATRAWKLVLAELDTDARIRAVNAPVAGKRMKVYEFVASLRASPQR